MSEENIGLWCSFPKENPKFEAIIKSIVIHTRPQVFLIEVKSVGDQGNGVEMFKSENEMNIFLAGENLIEKLVI